VGKVDDVVEVLLLFHVISDALWYVWAVSLSNSKEPCRHNGSDHMAFIVCCKRVYYTPIAVLAKVDRRLVNTWWKLPDVFTRRDVCEKYQEGLKGTTEV
jgi:hypothetical protein